MKYSAPEDVQKTRSSLGLCPTCGIQTQILHKNGNFTPITNSTVQNSRCLLCNQIPILETMLQRNDQLHTQINHDVLQSQFETKDLNYRALSESISTYPFVAHKSNGIVRIQIKPNQVRLYCPSDTSSTISKSSASDDDLITSQSSKSSLSLKKKYLNATMKNMTKMNGILKNRIPTAHELFQEGWNHLMGDNHTKIDKQIGERLITDAMHDGSIAAKAFCFFLGWGGHDQNYSKALKYLAKGIRSKRNVSTFLAIKGYFYMNGFGIKVDNKKGIRLIKKAAALDHACSQNTLGCC